MHGLKCYMCKQVKYQHKTDSLGYKIKNLTQKQRILHTYIDVGDCHMEKLEVVRPEN